MPLLIVPLVIGVLLLLWLLLLPLTLWQRYRMGKARRRAIGWLVKLNAWALLLSILLFTFSMWITNHWWPGALRYAVIGLASGVLVGVLGLWLSKFERTPQGLFYTPNAWLVLSLTLVIAVRLVMGFVELWRAWQGTQSLAMLPVFEHASLFAVAGLLMGYYLAYNWGLCRRLPPSHPFRIT